MRLLKTIAAALTALASRRQAGRASMDVGKSYFIRVATYDIVDNHLLITDPNQPRVVTLDPWPESVFAAANGQRTVDQFVAELGKQWGPDAPANLAAQVSLQLGRLVHEGLVKLIDEPRDLPAYLASPTAEQDPKEMKRQMIEDGFIPASV